MAIKENNFNNELSPLGTELLKKKKGNQKLGGWDFGILCIYLYSRHTQSQDTKPKNGAFG